MHTVFHAANAIETQLVTDVLAQCGIEAFVEGAGLQGAVGELPTSGLMRVCTLPGQADAARTIVAQWEAGRFSLPPDAVANDT